MEKNNFDKYALAFAILETMENSIFNLEVQFKDNFKDKKMKKEEQFALDLGLQFFEMFKDMIKVTQSSVVDIFQEENVGETKD